MADLSGIGDLLGFIRFKVSFFLLFVALSGYLMFNPPGIGVVFVAAASFFICAGGYAYNGIMDKKEDMINWGRVNPYVQNRKRGFLVVGICFMLGLMSSLFLPFWSFAFSVSGILACVVYSLFRMKSHLLVKNFYTGFGATQLFLVGAGVLTHVSLTHYLAVSSFIFMGSVISDLRDYDGDLKTGIRTLPVVLGYNIVKRMLYVSSAVFVALVFFLGFYHLYVFVPLSLLMALMVIKDKPGPAQGFNGLSFIFLAVSLAV